MLIGLIVGAVFVWWESRFREPIVPLDLFRIRTVAISVFATFFASFGFISAVVFLPRWFQTVAGMSATESGYSLLPLVFALIVSAVGSGQIVARTGRYKWLLTGSLLVLALGLWMMTNLHANTEQPVIWLWMAVTGLGIGPTFAVFTLIVQNAVRARQVGSATASVGFFQMIGGTVGLTIAGTWFATSLHLRGAAPTARRGRATGIRRRRSVPRVGASTSPAWATSGRPSSRHPTAVPAGRRAAHPEHRGRDLRGAVARDRVHVLDRHRRCAHRGGQHLVPRRGADAPDDGARGRRA